ncbi:hypothetical protein KBX22_02885 [Corynebacterium sp. CCUG 55013]|uniref:Glyoxalase-like domain-containing protein n=1 Tax=Corynebacterium pseudogenitalium TaxID=38303 RepID=A0ABD4TMX6_9CORY|nr:hypothetical protein [Corynebacterium pseudogenitalium]
MQQSCARQGIASVSKLGEFWFAATGCEIAADYGDFVMVDSIPAPGLVWTVMQDPEGNEFCVSIPGA